MPKTGDGGRHHLGLNRDADITIELGFLTLSSTAGCRSLRCIGQVPPQFLLTCLLCESRYIGRLFPWQTRLLALHQRIIPVADLFQASIPSLRWVHLRADTAQGADQLALCVSPPLCDSDEPAMPKGIQHTSWKRLHSARKLTFDLAKDRGLWRFNTRAISATGTFACHQPFNSVDVLALLSCV